MGEELLDGGVDLGAVHLQLEHVRLVDERVAVVLGHEDPRGLRRGSFRDGIVVGRRFPGQADHDGGALAQPVHDQLRVRVVQLVDLECWMRRRSFY